MLSVCDSSEVTFGRPGGSNPIQPFQANCRKPGCLSLIATMGKSPPERFFEKIIRIDKPPFCWEWQASLMPDGYPQFSEVIGGKSKTIRGNRWVWRFTRLGLPADRMV